MRVFVVGATGVVGRSLVPQLLAAGHEVTAISRRPDQVARLRDAGVDAFLADAFDGPRLTSLMTASEPEVVVYQLTAIPGRPTPWRIDAHQLDNVARIEGAFRLMSAARAAGVRRVIAQSVACAYRPEGAWVKAEGEALYRDAPEPFDQVGRAVFALEDLVLDAPDLEGVVLRYGWLYGPGTMFGAAGHFTGEVQRRLAPMVRGGLGRFSFVHVDDAAAAVLPALDGPAGAYNIVDDEPVTAAEWMPMFADAVGAEAPRRVPRVLGHMGGRYAFWLTHAQRGADNARARTELDWRPRFTSWREGFARSHAEELMRRAS